MDQATQQARIVRTDDLSVNLDTKVVAVGERPIRLTPKEWGFLELLCLNQGTTQSKKMIMRHLYGVDEADWPEIGIVEVWACMVRKKLDPWDTDKYIDTVWGQGFVLRVLVQTEDPAKSEDPAEIPVLAPDAFA